jgi:WD40 repeat protein
VAGHRARVQSIAVAPDGRTLASASDDHTIRVWDIIGGNQTRCLTNHQDKVRCVAYSPDGRHLASASDDGTVRVWEAPTGRQALCLVHRPKAYSVFYLQQGAALASFGSDGLVRVWEAATGKEFYRISAEKAVWGLAAHPEGSEIAILYQTKVSIWDSLKREEMRRISRDGMQKLVTLTYSPDGRLLAIGSEVGIGPFEHSIYVFEVASGKLIREARLGYRTPSALRFVEGSKLLACGTAEGQIVVFDMATQLVKDVDECGGVLALASSPDGRVLASGSSDTTILLWDTKHLRSDGLGGLTATPGGKEAKGLSGDHWQSLWRQLEGDDAGKAFRAIWAFVASPREAVAFLRTQAHPVPAVDREGTARLNPQPFEHQLPSKGESLQATQGDGRDRCASACRASKG